MSICTQPLQYDNCKDCTRNCEHAGKDREYIVPRWGNCKTTEHPKKNTYMEWLPVTEKLPVASCFCLAALKNGVVSQVCFETQGDHPYFWYRDSLHELKGEYEVTHWMPLPNHPERRKR